MVPSLAMYLYELHRCFITSYKRMTRVYESDIARIHSRYPNATHDVVQMAIQIYIASHGYPIIDEDVHAILDGMQE